MSPSFASSVEVMRRALALARQGEGFVEPNPQVGAVVVDSDLCLLGEGWHQKFGGPHAEVYALKQAGPKARRATLYVTLEPCRHYGKTPPCVKAIMMAGIGRVVVATTDPSPEVSGRGIAWLRAAGLVVEVGLLQEEAQELTAPFARLVTAGLPWVHAKWAMTLDGKIASRTGHSKWISNRASRDVVHNLRGRMDAIVIGIGTALADDPLLTARPTGPRVATRVVVDAQARLPLTSQLVQTAHEAPVLVAAGKEAPADRLAALWEAGVEVVQISAEKTIESVAGRHGPALCVRELLLELGRRKFTHVLCEGGSALLGAFFDAGLIDEAHVFVAPKLVGGSAALGPLGGQGVECVPELASLADPQIEFFERDVYIHGRLRREATRPTAAPPPRE